MENRTIFSEKSKAIEVFKWSLHKFKPFSIAYWILLLLAFPMVDILIMITTLSYGPFKDYIDDMEYTAYKISGTGFAFIAVLYSVIIAIMAFSYMHNKRSVDWFGSLPVSRRTLFFGRYFATVVSSVVPILVFGTMGALLTFNGTAIIETYEVMAILIVSVIGNISFIAFISVCCGTVGDVIVSYAVINIVYPFCVLICGAFPTEVIPGLTIEYLPTTVYTLVCPMASFFVATYGNGVTLHFVWWIGLSIALMVGCFFLCKKRKSETAQNAFAFAAVEIVIKFVTCFVAGFGLGWCLANVAPYDFVAQYVWFVIGFVIGEMVANILLHIVFYRGLSKYVNSLKECIVVFATGMVFIFVIVTGAAGYDKRIPEAAEIKGASIKMDGYEEFYINGKDILEKYSENEAIINDILDVHSQIIDNTSESKVMGAYPIITTNYYDGTAREHYDIKIKYYLKNGREFTRCYENSYGAINVPKSVDEMSINTVNVLELIPAEYIQYIHLNSNRDEDMYAGYSLDNTGEDFDTEKVGKLVKAIAEDIKEAGEMEDEAGIYSINIDYSSNYKNQYGDYDYINCYIEIPETYTRTWAVLDETGYGNIHYYEMKQRGYRFNDIEKEGYTMDGRTIYFEMPEEWDTGMEVRCNMFSEEEWCYMMPIDHELTKCEKVSDRIYKYVMPSNNGEYLFDSVIFYQYNNSNMNSTENVALNQSDEEYNLLRLIKKSEEEMWEYGEYTGTYKNEWYKYEE